MDTKQRPSTDSDGYRRDNWFGDPEVHTVADKHRETGTDWLASEIVDEKAESVAWTMLRGIAPKLCGVTVDDPAKDPAELTDPIVHPHGEGNREHFRRARVNPTHGYISGGESTDVRLGDVSEERFLGVVEVMLDHWVETGHITEELGDDLYRDVQAMKSTSDIDDTEAIKRLVKDAVGTRDFAAVVDMMLSTWRRAGHIDADNEKEMMIEAVRLKNRAGMSEEDVIERLADRALPNGAPGI